MTNLIRNCAHYSTHQTLIDQSGDASHARTIKTTFAPDGVAGLQAEYDGLTWYASRLGQDIATIVLQFRATTGYARLETRYIDGTVVPMPADPDGLSNKFEAAVDYYIAHLWSGSDMPSHGDFSLSNHVFDQADKIARIIDWEHFNNALPPQYDPLYMITEPFLFWHVNNKTSSARSITKAQRCIAKLHEDIGLGADATAMPASWLRETADAHREVWGCQVGKVPFLNAAPQNIAAVDALLGTA